MKNASKHLDKQKLYYDELFNQILNSLKTNLVKWDKWNWSYYDLEKNPSSYYYHLLHIKQLNILFLLTGDNFFKNVSDNWNRKRKIIFICIIALVEKIFFRLLK